MKKEFTSRQPWIIHEPFQLFIHCAIIRRNRNILQLASAECVTSGDHLEGGVENKNTIQNLVRPSSTHTRGLILLFWKYIDIICCSASKRESKNMCQRRREWIFFINDKNIHLTHGLSSSSSFFRVVFVALFMSFHSWYLMLSPVALAGVRWCGVKVHSHQTFVTFNKKNQLSFLLWLGWYFLGGWTVIMSMRARLRGCFDKKIACSISARHNSRLI